MPGKRLFIVTPCGATWRDVPATYPVNPERAAFDNPNCAIGALTDCDVIFTTRPQPCVIICGKHAFINAIGASIFASSALMKSSRSQSDHNPGGGPPALVTRISSCPAASNTLARSAFMRRFIHNIGATGVQDHIDLCLGQCHRAAFSQALR